jgi:polysaccharide pyruvyl transferase WcaK-like protein
MPELSAIKVISLTEALDQVSDMDLLVFGGGPLMAVNAILDMLALFNLSAKAQIPTVLAGCGVGPLGSTLHNQLITRILKLSSVLIFRDEQSKATATMLGIDTQKNRVSEDPAHVWLRQNRPQSIETDRNEKRLILGLREWPQQQYSTYSNKEAQSITQQYEMNLMNGLVKLVEEFPELRIIPFPMCTNHHGSDDRFYYRQLFRRYSAQYNKIKSNIDHYCLTHEISPRDSCTLFSGTDAAVAMRFHSLVFALEMQIPSVALDYTLGKGKVSSLANRFNVPSLSLEKFSTEQFVDIVKPMLQTPNKIKPITKETNFVEDFKHAISLLKHESIGV